MFVDTGASLCYYLSGLIMPNLTKELLNMKKFICFALLLALCVSLCSCAVFYDAFGNGNKGKEISAPRDDYSIPFKEGYYLGDKYALKLVYNGNEAEYSYDVYMCDAYTGAEAFLGMVYGLEADASEATVPGYSDVRVTLRLTYSSEKKIIRVTDESGGYGSSYDGEYIYYGEEWQVLSEDNADYLTSGTYRNGSYKIVVTVDEDSINISVRDADNIALFEGTQKTSGKVNTLAFAEGASTIRFLKGVDANGAFIDLVEAGGSITEAYSGRYYLSK